VAGVRPRNQEIFMRFALRRRTAALAAAALVLPAVAVGATAASPAAALPAAALPGAASAPLPSVVTLSGLRVENSFVSSTGWVKPGDSYPSRILLTNEGSSAVGGVSVTVPATRGMSWTGVRSAVGSPRLSSGTVTWTFPTVAAGATLALVLEAQAASTAQEPTIVWRNLSSIASVSVGGGSATKVASHGPKVIPPTGGYETARYGDRPFPVVPVDYADFTHSTPAAELETVINDPANPASTFNLFQEMSFGQLFPKGVIGSIGVDSRPVAPEDELRFSTIDPDQTNTCTGVTTVDPTTGEPTAAYTERISDGWYQLPGQRQYYGADANGSALVGAVAGVGALQAIDSGCGPTAKAAYDAAVVADPDIDYNDFDTDKDGVVDFFEVVFQGCGGNGASQLGPAGGCDATDTSDNIWPHSSSLEFSYTDPETGLTGYTSKDRLKDLEGNLLFYTDDSYTRTTTAQTDFPAFVRVGPYNVNPETSIEFASVISHEYGHSLGLPDYYSTGSRETYGDFNLMATDKGHHMDVIGKKEMGWIVPEVLAPGSTRSVKDWQDSKIDTGTIRWVTPDGTPYTLSAANGDYGIHNGEAYVAALPGRQLLDPAKIEQGASGKQVWYSRQGNDFGCPPIGGHNLDIAIPGLGDVAEGTPVTATFNSYFDIEWDYDYAFLLTGEPDDKGKVTYTSHESENGYTTPAATNPNANSCQSAYGNGITGTPASYDAGTAPVDRVAGNYPDGPFVEDSYDISELAGVDGGVLRFSYATDPGLARLGWVIDDLVVKAGDQVLFDSDFEDGDGGSDDPRVYNGGCKEDLSTSGGLCTEGWAYVAAGTPSELEHGYLMEMRDRSGFDVDGRGESDRGPTAFEPGLLLTYTDEAHGYGNVGTDNPPAQTPLDSVPQPEEDAPDLNDATFTAADGRNAFTDAAATPHVDNYSEPTRNPEKDADGDGSQPWTFDYDCLSFTVDALSGDINNEVDAYDLVGDVRFATSRGCAPFNYGLAVAEPEPQTPGGGASGSETGTDAEQGGSGDAGGDGSGPTAEQPRAAGGSLPRTGEDLLVALALGLVLVAGGSWLLARRETLA
jgi:immune inhibitor A